MVNSAFWRGRRVFVTGHTGFKGAWLTLWLRRLGAEVTGYALAPPSEPSLWQLTGLARDVRDLRADVRDLEGLCAAVEEHRPEIVLHLAAQSLVREGYRAPVDTYATNVMGTVNLLEAVRRTAGVEAVVIVTTDKCYDNREWVWPYRENEPMGGKDPYSSSKGCAELVTAAYRDSYFSADDTPRVASARAGNVIGGGDWAVDRLLPDLMRGATAGDTVHIRAPHAVRPWQHVLEPLAGYLVLAERLCGEGGEGFAEGWNFGPALDDARPVAWIVRRIAELWPDLDWREDPGPHPAEARNLKLDASKACAHLGWRPHLPLADALEWLVAWYVAHRDGVDPRQVSEEQIERYEDLIAESD